MALSSWVKYLKYPGVMLAGLVAVATPGLAQMSDNQVPDQEWNFWPQLFGDPDPPLTSRTGAGRGGDLCPLTPVVAEGARVWSDRPTFAWLGQAEGLYVSSDEETSWHEAIASQPTSGETIHWFQYGAEEKLATGQDYTWAIKWVGLDQSPDFYFEVIGGTERQAIDQDLMTLTQELSGESPETVALAKAKYFADHNLWSDFWSELLSLDNPSPEVIGVMQETAEYLCRPAEEE